MVSVMGDIANKYLAIILGPEVLRQYLINYARPLIYTTFMSYPSVAAIRAAYSLLVSGQTVLVSASGLISHDVFV